MVGGIRRFFRWWYAPRHAGRWRPAPAPGPAARDRWRRAARRGLVVLKRLEAPARRRATRRPGACGGRRSARSNASRTSPRRGRIDDHDGAAGGALPARLPQARQIDGEEIDDAAESRKMNSWRPAMTAVSPHRMHRERRNRDDDVRPMPKYGTCIPNLKFPDGNGPWSRL